MHVVGVDQEPDVVTDLDGGGVGGLADDPASVGDLAHHVLLVAEELEVQDAGGAVADLDVSESCG